MLNIILYNEYGMGDPNLENIEKVYKIEKHENFMDCNLATLERLNMWTCT